jgi:colanic acid biosynthesis glycosyl transferase WcaI
MAEYFAARGHRVEVATTFPHYPSWTLSSGRRLMRREHLNGVTVRRRTLYVPARQSARERALYEGSMYALGLTALIGRARPNVVLGFIPSLASGSLAATAARIHRVPFGLIIHDLMGAGAEQSGIQGGRSVARLVRRREQALATSATGIAVIAVGFRSYFTRFGVPESRIHRVRTWTQPHEPATSRTTTRERLGWRDHQFVCLHAGNMGMKQGLDNLLDAARLLAGQADVVLSGDGNDRARLEARVRTEGLQNVKFCPPQEPGHYEAMLAAADVLIVNQRPSIADMSLPSKLTSYFAAGNPVVAAVALDGETATEVATADAGILVPAGQPDRLAAAILQLRDHPDRARVYAVNGRRYSRTVLAANAILAGYERFALHVARS